MRKLGNKIAIVGVHASGKSLFTRKLASKTNLPPVFVDTLLWKHGWEYVGDDKATKELDELSSKESWIIEGYMIPKIKQFVFSRADAIIFLDYPRLLVIFRYIKRWWQHRKIPRPELNGNTEKLRLKMIMRIWKQDESRLLRTMLIRDEFKNKAIILTSPRIATDFIHSIK